MVLAYIAAPPDPRYIKANSNPMLVLTYCTKPLLMQEVKLLAVLPRAETSAVSIRSQQFDRVELPCMKGGLTSYSSRTPHPSLSLLLPISSISSPFNIGPLR